MQITERDLRWRKSLHSSGNGACIEVAAAEGRVVVRDSKDPVGPVLFCSVAGWRSFLFEASDTSPVPRT